MHSGVLNTDWIKITLHVWTQGYQSIYKHNVYLTCNAKSILQNILTDFNNVGVVAEPPVCEVAVDMWA